MKIRYLLRHWFNIEKWREIYSFVIPTIITLAYIGWLILNRTGIVECVNNIVDSENINNLLESLITFISLVIGVFGFLLPILLSNKKDCGMVEYFFENADKKKFLKYLKSIILTGFIVILLSSLLFLNDILMDVAIDIFICLEIWFLLFFMCISYRFISLLLAILIVDKKKEGKKVIEEMNEKQVEKLNETIKNMEKKK